MSAKASVTSRAKARLMALWACAALLGLPGCGGGGEAQTSAPPSSPPPPAPPASVERLVSPKSTDSQITQAFDAHVAINPSPTVAAAGKLVVFLPGTQATPEGYRLILRAAAARGYHALGLNYVNGSAVGQLCASDADADCHGKVRREVVTGQDLSPLVNVGAADSIENRLAKLLAYLHANNPTEGWGQFLSAGQTPVWAQMHVAGHSQGGGHAALLAKMYSVNRAAYFSSPADWRNDANAPATWLSGVAATPVQRQYGFSHLRDPLVPWVNVRLIWQAMHLDTLGAPVSVDTAASPFGGSHQLSTDAVPGSNASTAAHGATVFDAAVPKNPDGSPIFAPVWSAILFP